MSSDARVNENSADPDEAYYAAWRTLATDLYKESNLILFGGSLSEVEFGATPDKCIPDLFHLGARPVPWLVEPKGFFPTQVTRLLKIAPAVNPQGQVEADVLQNTLGEVLGTLGAVEHETAGVVEWLKDSREAPSPRQRALLDGLCETLISREFTHAANDPAAVEDFVGAMVNSSGAIRENLTNAELEAGICLLLPPSLVRFLRMQSGREEDLLVSMFAGRPPAFKQQERRLAFIAQLKPPVFRTYFGPSNDGAVWQADLQGATFLDSAVSVLFVPEWNVGKGTRKVWGFFFGGQVPTSLRELREKLMSAEAVATTTTRLLDARSRARKNWLDRSEEFIAKEETRNGEGKDTALGRALTCLSEGISHGVHNIQDLWGSTDAKPIDAAKKALLQASVSDPEFVLAETLLNGGPSTAGMGVALAKALTYRVRDDAPFLKLLDALAYFVARRSFQLAAISEKGGDARALRSLSDLAIEAIAERASKVPSRKALRDAFQHFQDVAQLHSKAASVRTLFLQPSLCLVMTPLNGKGGFAGRKVDDLKLEALLATDQGGESPQRGGDLQRVMKTLLGLQRCFQASAVANVFACAFDPGNLNVWTTDEVTLLDRLPNGVYAVLLPAKRDVDRSVRQEVRLLWKMRFDS